MRIHSVFAQPVAHIAPTVTRATRPGREGLPKLVSSVLLSSGRKSRLPMLPPPLYLIYSGISRHFTLYGIFILRVFGYAWRSLATVRGVGSSSNSNSY